MKKFTIQIILLLVIIAGALVFFSPAGKSPKFDFPFLPSPPGAKILEVNGNILQVEVADTESKRKQGLGGRESIATDAGMLFIYSKPGIHSLWMKGMSFPLDFIWINEDRVVDITANATNPPPLVKDADLIIYSSGFNVDKILEVNAGVAQKFNIKVGDTIILK